MHICISGQTGLLTADLIHHKDTNNGKKACLGLDLNSVSCPTSYNESFTKIGLDKL